MVVLRGVLKCLVFMCRSLGTCRDKPPVNDADVDGDEQDDKEIIEQSEESEHGFREDVERRDEVEEGKQTAEKHSEAEHPDETTERKHLGDAVS